MENCDTRPKKEKEKKRILDSYLQNKFKIEKKKKRKKKEKKKRKIMTLDKKKKKKLYRIHKACVMRFVQYMI